MHDIYMTEHYAELNPTWHEEDSPWKARQVERIIRDNSLSFASLCEVGCGTGYVLSGVSQAFPRAKLFGSEIFTTGLAFAADRLPSAEFIQMDARKIPFAAEFDAVGAFDVLEHIEEDRVVLAQLHKALKPGGFMLATVPQHPCLWSPSDDHACHVRRYTRLDLHEKIETAGFSIVRSTSFITLLLPAMWASRISGKRKSTEQFDPLAEFHIPAWLNTLFSKLLDVERSLIQTGIDFAVGGSRLVIAQKRRSN